MVINPAIIVFDMDGVLVDVAESYRETIVRTVEHFTGRTIERALIQQYKNQGGWNNDWELSQRICADLGVAVEYNTVVEYFNRLFLDEGLIHRERWLPKTARSRYNAGTRKLLRPISYRLVGRRRKAKARPRRPAADHGAPPRQRNPLYRRHSG
jgi:phosphoglycolate phosphatase-like HAD superfamily hydrolase